MINLKSTTKTTPRAGLFTLLAASAVLAGCVHVGAAETTESVSRTPAPAPSATPAPAMTATSLDYRKDGANYILVLKAGQKVIASLIELETREKIQGANFNAIGAVQNTQVSVYNLKKQAYGNKTFPLSGEVVALTGSMTYFEDKPAIHAHIAVAGPDFKVYGGHLQEADVSMILEVFVYPTTSKINRHQSEFPSAKTIDLSLHD